MMMALLLTGVLAIQTIPPVLGAPIWVSATITNNSDQEQVIVNPEVGVPPLELDWKASNQAYRIAVLMSFGLIKITLRDAENQLVESKGLMPWVTPILGKRVLQPHDNLVIDFDLNELFVIDSAGLYSLSFRYGDDAVYANASMDLDLRPCNTAEC